MVGLLRKLRDADANFEAQLTEALAARAEDAGSVAKTVTDIIAQVRGKGDAALLALTEEFDRVQFDAVSVQVSEAEIAQAEQECSPEVKAALQLAAGRVTSFHEKQMPKDIDYVDDAGVRLGMRWTAIEAVGVYVPGGLASYPSSVLHNAIAAKVAGVPRVVMVVPTPDGAFNPAILVAAKIAGITEIYKIGGAQAVAALAYGTETIAPVYKIVGPGNAYVAEAKRQVFGKVGIDTIAGPSEILVYSDSDTNPKWVAADLLSQAEHDTRAQSILVAHSEAFIAEVEAEMTTLLETLPRAEIAAQSLKDFGLAIVVKDADSALKVINQVAPEHLELAVENPDALLPQIINAGAIFMGRYSPEAIGDYVAGPSHVLPTTGAAKFSSGLSVYDFIKKSSVIHCSKDGFAQLADATEALAQSEGLGAHGLSVSVRR